MKTVFIILILLFVGKLYSQETQEIQLENRAEREDGETEDDYSFQQLEYFRKHQININKCSVEELRQLELFTELQLNNFILYRKQFGNFISIYETQAIPGWDIELIRKILPFITIKEEIGITTDLLHRLKGGNHQLLLRLGIPLSKSAEYLLPDTLSSAYMGSPMRLWIRYKYQFKRILQFGFSADKDAGEEFFKGAQKKGFDFYSFHFFVRQVGVIKSLAIGDFTINLGQGLLQWQNMAFKKSAVVMAIKREGDMVRPYNSAAEYAFHRGAAINLRKKHWDLLVFGSMRNLSANIREDSSQFFITSISTTGYHRTKNELQDRNQLKMFSVGLALRYISDQWRIGLNSVNYSFNKPILKDFEPYNIYAFSGNRLSNYSIDYDYTIKNIHLFGEFAINNKTFKPATIHGALISLDRRVDISLLYRRIHPAYQSFFSNAFTETTLPINENGFYTGFSLRPFRGWTIDAYYDIYRFPWLKFRVNSSSEGYDYLFQVTYKPSKQTELYARFKTESKPINQSGSDDPLTKLINPVKKDWRIQLNFRLNDAILIRQRLNILSINQENDRNQFGFLWFTDLIYKPLMKTYSGNFRFQYFESDSYDSRIYAFENDVAFNNSIPSFSGAGYRLYINLHLDIRGLCQLKNKLNIDLWFKASQTIAGHSFGTNGAISGTSGQNFPELKFQFALGW